MAQAGTAPPIKLDLNSAAPAFLLDGIAYPLNLSPEPPHTELVRLSNVTNRPSGGRGGKSGEPAAVGEDEVAAFVLEPIATVSHKASLKPGSINKDALEKLGHSVRSNRELAEKERESRRTVLLDSTGPSRSSSQNRFSPGTSASVHAKRAASPASTPGGSRHASPAIGSSTSRPPSRLSAVPTKPAKAPTSSFRIGKGTVPSSLSMSRSNSKEKKVVAAVGDDAAAGGVSTGPAPSPSTSVSTPPSPAISAVKPSPSSSGHDSDIPSSLDSHAVLPTAPQAKVTASTSNPTLSTVTSVPQARQTSSSSSSSSSVAGSDSTDSSHLKSSSTRTSLSSAASPPSVAALASALAKPSPTSAVSAAAAMEAKSTPVPTTAPVTARGGVMKGKETLKKEKRQEERAKGKVVLSKATISDSDEEADDPSTLAVSSPVVKSASPPAATTTAFKVEKKNRMSVVAAPPLEPTASSKRSTTTSPLKPTAASLPTVTKAHSKRPSIAHEANEPSSESAVAKKKRKLLNNVGEDSESGAGESRVKDHGRSSSKEKEREKERSGSRASTPASSSKPSKKRTRKEEAWYSSSEEEGEVSTSTSSAARGGGNVATTSAAPLPLASSATLPSSSANSPGLGGAKRKPIVVKRTRTVSSGSHSGLASGSETDDSRGRTSMRPPVPSHLQSSTKGTGSPLRASSTAPPSSSTSSVKSPREDSARPTSASFTIDSDEVYERLRKEFQDAYGPYRDLHAKLMRERDVLVSGKGREVFEPDEVEKLVARIEKQRARLEDIQEAIRVYNSKESR